MVRNALRQAAGRLAAVSDSPEFEAQVIFSEVLGRDFLIRDIKSGDVSIDGASAERLEKMILRRLKGEPLQYIVGSWEFYGVELLTKKGALIPRQDTETLVETALSLIKDIKRPKVLDLCAGTGCVALAIKKERPDALVTALEKYPEAYEILLENVKIHPGVTAFLGDALSGACAAGFEGYDLITANPPYLSSKDMENLQREVCFEPKTSLFGGSDGLDFYRALPEVWFDSLIGGGWMAVEFGINQGAEVSAQFEVAGYKSIRLIKDLSGKDRVAAAQK